MEDVLVWCHRKLGPIARRLGIQKISRRLYQGIATRWYASGRLATALQNGRSWKLRHDVAERGELQELDTILWLRDVVRPGMTVLDVGANVGQMTLEAGILVGPAGHVVAIEPSAGNIEYLRAHVGGNDLADRVTVIEAACAEVDGGDVAFFVVTPDGVSSVGSGHNIIGAAPIVGHSSELQVKETRVLRVSIDGLCRRLNLAPAVIKIDVEGAELLVLQGAMETLRRLRPHVRVAFHPFAFSDPKRASEELFSFIAEVGYRLEGVQPGATLELAEYQLVPE